jgi:DNA-binding transcriptional MerR regulator
VNKTTGDTTTAAAPVVGYRGPQVCAIVGISYRQLDYWARTNLMRPSISDAKGSGSQRRYSYKDLVELKVIKSLLDAKVSLQSARTAVEYLRDHLGEDIVTANLVLCGENPLLVREDGEIIDLIRGGQGVLNIVPLSPVVTELNAAILQLFPLDTVPLLDGSVVPQAVAN